MTGLGALLVLLGLGSLILPMLDIQFTLMMLFDDYQPIAGIAVAAIGAVLLFLGSRRKSAAAAAASTPPSSPPPSA